MAKIICGVDVSAETLEARIGRDGPILQVDQSAEGIAKLASFCKANGVELVAMEATGGYEKMAFALLWAADVACAIVNPRAVRRFAEGMGILEKTDRIDAGLIAWYAEVKSIVAQKPASAAQAQLRAFVDRLRQITQNLVVQTNQRRLIEEPRVRASIDEVIALLRRQAKSFEVQIAQLIGADPLWQKLDEAFRSIKGIADRTCSRLMAELPEIGTISGKAAGKLTGLAPIAKDSGKIKGKRRVRGGRSGVRSILFVVAEIVRRYDDDFKAFHRKLSQAGKPKKVIRVALARKLLIRLNAKARDVRQNLALAP